MRIATRVQWLIIFFVTASVTLTGCTTGKFASTMDSLAFWKKKDSAEDIVSPPSRSFDTRTQLAKSDTGGGQPVPPSAKSSPVEPRALAAAANKDKPVRKPIRKPYSFENESKNRDAALGFTEPKTASPSFESVAMDEKMPEKKNLDFKLPKVSEDAITSKPYQPPTNMGSLALPRERTYSTPSNSSFSGAASRSASMASTPNQPKTFNNPYVNNLSPARTGTPISTSDSMSIPNSGQQTGYTEYSKTAFGEFTPRNNNSNSKAPSGENEGISKPQNSNNSGLPVPNQLKPVATEGSSSTSGELPETLKQVQGSYTPGSIKPPEPISFGAGGFTPPTSTGDSKSNSSPPPVSRSSGFQLN